MDDVSRLQSRLECQLDSVDRLFRGRTADAMDRRSKPGKWTAHEILAHLARHHELTLERIALLRREASPEFPRYRAEEDPEWKRYCARPPEELLSSLVSTRALIEETMGELSEGELARAGLHPSFGEMTLFDVVDFFLLHEAHHLYVAMGLLGPGGG